MLVGGPDKNEYLHLDVEKVTETDHLISTALLSVLANTMGRIQAPPRLGDASSWQIYKKQLKVWKLTC